MVVSEQRIVPGRRLLHWAAISIALIALYAFLQDFMSPDWPAGILAPVLLIGFREAVSAAPEDGIMRAALWQGALLAIPFMGTYGVLDLYFASDTPVWLISPMVVAALWILFWQVVDIEAD